MTRYLTWCLLLLTLLMAGPVMAQSSQGGESRWFSLETINSGLGEPPEKVRRQTPREALRSFLTLTGEGDVEAAAHLLNLTELPAEEQAARGGKLARQLASVLQRGDWLQPSDLSSRRDAMVEDMSGQHPLTGQPRRNLLLTSLEADGESHAIRIARYRAGEQEPGVIEPDKLCCYATAQHEATIEVRCYLMTREPMGGWVAENNLREKLLAYIREEHPEWWPRDVVAVSRRDVALGRGYGEPTSRTGADSGRPGSP